MNTASIRPSILAFLVEAPVTAYSLFKSKFLTTTKKPTEERVRLQVVNECLFPGNAHITLTGDDRVTVVYDKESLDSLYALSFFMFLYGDRVQPIAYQNVSTTTKQIYHSKETIILGVDLPMADLLCLNSLTESLRILSYRGTYDYLYDECNHSRFFNVVLYMPDFEYEIGHKGVEQLENTMAMMLKVMYYDGNDFQNWPQYQYAKAVAHATSMNVSVPAYGMTKAVLSISKVEKDGREVNKAKVHNHNGALMMDFRQKLEEAANHPETIKKMHELQPDFNITNYIVRRKRMLDHILKTGVLQSWKRPKGGAIACNTIPIFGPDVNDMVDLAMVNNDSIVCVEDAGLYNNYYVYAKEIGRAMEIAESIAGGGWFKSPAPGETNWRRGNLLCVSKRKEKNAQR